MTEAAQLALINAIPSIIAAILAGLGVIFGRQAVANIQANEARSARSRQAVFETKDKIVSTEAKVDVAATEAQAAKESAQSNTILVNGMRSELLLQSWKDKARIAELTGAASDRAAADTAEQIYTNHKENVEPHLRLD